MRVPVVAALYVDPHGPYYGRSDAEPWGELEDARNYDGPWSVVAHPPCQRWGRFWYRGKLGADGGCFKAALGSVRRWGGVLEHPEGSHAWEAFGLPRPVFGRGWTAPDAHGGRSCSVDQSTYGHRARKRTWLYYVGVDPPELDWRHTPPRVAVAANARTRRLGLEVMGELERRLSPPRFSETLLALARGSRTGEFTMFR